MFRWGIFGAGNISNHFCRAIDLLPDAEVCAVASHSLERAQTFAATNAIAAAYNSYEELLQKEKPDAIYIGTVPSFHFEQSMLCLDYRTPFLCEKAMFLTYADAKTVFDRCRNLNVFGMEALWSRFIPSITTAKQWMEDGLIGTVASASIEIGIVADEDHIARYLNPELGGGAMYDVGVYTIELADFMFGKPARIPYVFTRTAASGVDITNDLVLEYPNHIVTLTASTDTVMDMKMVITGNQGRIEVANPHMAVDAKRYDQNGALAEHFKDSTPHGFIYEIRDVMRCVQAGQIESSVEPHRATLDCAKIFDLLHEDMKQR